MVAPIKRRASGGLPWTVYALRGKVLEIVKYCDLKHRSGRVQSTISRWIRRGSIGKDWLKSLLRRHRDELSIGMSDKLKRERWSVRWKAAASTYDVLHECKRRSPTLHPGKLLNTDETSFSPDGRAKRVVTARGAKNTHVMCADGRLSMTLLPFVFANGLHIPPVAIVKGESTSGDPFTDLPRWWFDRDLQSAL
mmetsp:Transcript_18251/g.51135  ORF Transcript_18251/g.51135 Transcript_18251/m.51135 type:complete len:194 (-) Transcript_18251:40-621(-)